MSSRFDLPYKSSIVQMALPIFVARAILHEMMTRHLGIVLQSLGLLQQHYVRSLV